MPYQMDDGLISSNMTHTTDQKGALKRYICAKRRAAAKANSYDRAEYESTQQSAGTLVILRDRKYSKFNAEDDTDYFTLGESSKQVEVANSKWTITIRSPKDV